MTAICNVCISPIVTETAFKGARRRKLQIPEESTKTLRAVGNLNLEAPAPRFLVNFSRVPALFRP
jgi:hypothetical protein